MISQIEYKMSSLDRLFKMALLSGDKNSINYHIKHGTNINAIDANGRTPLMLAAINGNLEICKLFLENGADQNIYDSKGNCAYSYAFLAGIGDAYKKVAENISSSNNLINSTEKSLSFQTSQILDLSNYDSIEWLAECEATNPPENLECLTGAVKLQNTISEHKPINHDADWDDINILLPDPKLLRSKKTIKFEILTNNLLKLIYRNINEGWISKSILEKATFLLLESNGIPFDNIYFLIENFGLLIEERPSIYFLSETSHNTKEIDQSLIPEIKNLLHLFFNDQDEILSYYYESIPKYSFLSAEDESLISQKIDTLHDQALSIIADSFYALSLLISNITPEKTSRNSSYYNNHPQGAINFNINNILDYYVNNSSDNNYLFLQFIRDLKPSWGVIEKVFRAIDITDPTSKNLSCILKIFYSLRNKLVKSNIRLAAFVARKYTFSKLPLSDLIQEANIGLIKAASGLIIEKNLDFQLMLFGG